MPEDGKARRVSSSVTRRKLLALTGGTAFAGLAGCQGDGGGGTTTGGTTVDGTTADGTTTGGTTEDGTDTSTGGQLMEPVFDLPIQAGSPADWNMNNLGPPPSQGIYPRAVLPWFWDGFAWTFNGFYEPVLDIVSDYGFDTESDPATAYVEFHDDRTWWNGDPVTVDGNYMNTKIRLLGSNDFYGVTKDVLQDVTKVDDYRLEYTYNTLPNPVSRVNHGRRGLLNGWAIVTEADVPPDFQREFFERLQDASNEDEVFAASEASVQKELSVDDLMSNGWGNGPLMPEENGISDTAVTLRKFDDHPHADSIAVDKVRLRNVSGLDRKRQLTTQDELDGDSEPFPQNIRGSSPEYLQTVAEVQGEGLWTLCLNWKNEHLARPNVRRAIAAGLPFDQMASTMSRGQPTYHAEKQTGMDTAHNERWFDQGFMDSLIDYPYEADEEQAAAYMEEAGYNKSNGTWTHGDGSTPNFNIVTQTGINWALTGDVVKQFLNSFGIPASSSGVSETQWVSEIETGNFDIYTVKGQSTYRTYAHSGNYGSLGFKDLESSFAEGQETGRWGKPLVATVPEDVGATSVSGSGRQLDLPQMWESLIAASTREDMNSLMQDFAWYWNYTLPHITWYGEAGGFWGDTRNFTFPSTEDHPEAYQDDIGYMVKLGYLQGKTQ